MKYELDWTRYYPKNNHYTLIAILTGLDIEEIIAASPDKDGWRGSDFKDIFAKLGYNTNHRFIKFDPNTDKPCIMRFKLKGTKAHPERSQWYVLAYYNDQVCMGNCYCTLEEFKYKYRTYRITSMLQVWI